MVLSARARRFALHLCVVGASALLGTSVGRAQEPVAGEVTLPLERYLDLVERAEREPLVERPVAAVTRQVTRLDIASDSVRAVTEIDVLVRGNELAPVPIAVPGTIERATVEPADGGSLGWSSSLARREGATNGADSLGQPPGLALGQPTFLARRPGEHRLEIVGRHPAPRDGGAVRIVLPASGAPLSVAEVTLSATLGWSAPGALVVEDVETASSRRLRLALPSDQPVTFSTRGRGDVGDDDVTANAVTATALSIGALDARRTDAVLLEVTRGALPTLSLRVPAGLEIERAETSGGDALLVEQGDAAGGRTVRVEPERPLEGIAFARLEQRPRPEEQPSFRVPLPPIRPTIEPRAHYLLLATAVAAELEPEPAEAWQRVDSSDLPGAVRLAIPGASPVSVWRLSPGAETDRLGVRVERAPLAGRAATVVRHRRSTTLLTPEGTLVQRESLELESREGSFELLVPEGAVVWTARVDGLLVRPVVDGASVRLPLSGGEGESTTIELTCVTDGAVAPGRTELTFSPPQVAAPVLVHDWRLLLPEDARYRFAAGDLLPVELAAAQPIGIYTGSGGGSTITGTVRGTNGEVLPGVVVTLELDGTSRVVITDAQGRYAFSGLEAGRGVVRAELEGFGRQQTNVRLRRDGAVRAELVLSPAANEMITVTSEAPRLDRFAAEEELDAIRNGQLTTAYQQALTDLQQGTVGGVRPLEVEIPERGKLLQLSGVLPPPSVSVTLEARRRR